MDRGTIRPGGAIGGILKAERRGRGGGCRHIATRDRGGAFVLPSVWPHPRGDVLTAQGMGENLEKRPARVLLSRCGFPRVSLMTAPAPPGAGEEARGRAGWGHIATRDRGQGRHMDAKSRRCLHIATRDRREGACPLSAPPLWRYHPRSRVGEPEKNKGGDAGILNQIEWVLVPPSAPPPRGDVPTVQCLMIRPGCGFP